MPILHSLQLNARDSDLYISVQEVYHHHLQSETTSLAEKDGSNLQNPYPVIPLPYENPEGFQVGFLIRLGDFRTSYLSCSNLSRSTRSKSGEFQTAQKVLMSLVLVFLNLRGRPFFDTPTFEKTFIRFRNDEVFHFGLIRENLMFYSRRGH